MNKYDHKEGITFSGAPFWVGLTLILSSVFISVWYDSALSDVVSIVFVGIGILLLLSIKGVEFSFQDKKASRYLSFILFKLKYDTYDLKNLEAIELNLYTDTTRMNMTSITTTVRTRVYELHLKLNEDVRILIADSTDYSKAVQLMNTLSDGLGVTAENKFEERLASAKNRREKHPKR